MSTAEKLLDSLVAVNIELRAWADPNTRKLGVQAEALAGDLVIEHGDLVIEHGDLLAALRSALFWLEKLEEDRDEAAFQMFCDWARETVARAEGGDEQ